MPPLLPKESNFLGASRIIFHKSGGKCVSFPSRKAPQSSVFLTILPCLLEILPGVRDAGTARLCHVGSRDSNMCHAAGPMSRSPAGTQSPWPDQKPGPGAAESGVLTGRQRPCRTPQPPRGPPCARHSQGSVSLWEKLNTCHHVWKCYSQDYL